MSRRKNWQLPVRGKLGVRLRAVDPVRHPFGKIWQEVSWVQPTSDQSDTLAMDKDASIPSHITFKHKSEKGGMGDVRQMLTIDDKD